MTYTTAINILTRTINALGELGKSQMQDDLNSVRTALVQHDLDDERNSPEVAHDATENAFASAGTRYSL